MTRLNHFSDEIFALVAHVRRSVVAVRGARGSGAGVLIGNQLIVTAAHVVEGASRCQLAGERGYRAVMAERADCDLALIDGRCVDRPFLPFARRVRVGELAVAVGCAFDVEGLSTIGIVSGFASGFQVGDRIVSDAIKADVPTAQGSSGGALANTRGELIGIVIGGTKDGGLSVSIGANRVREFALGTRDVVKAWRS